jgi:hypothetical protein
MLLFIYGPKEYIYFISPYVIPPLIIFFITEVNYNNQTRSSISNTVNRNYPLNSNRSSL